MDAIGDRHRPADDPIECRRDRDIARIERRLRDAKRRCENPRPRDGTGYLSPAVTFDFESPAIGARQLFARLGPIPPGMSLDRRNPWLGYSLDNLRYADASTQRRNQKQMY
jgi:hypothetical protein